MMANAEYREAGSIDGVIANRNRLVAATGVRKGVDDRESGLDRVRRLSVTVDPENPGSGA
jgi:hypothetical protein